jgi:hypothetical protein
MLNKETFQTNPADYQLANQGVAKILFPPNTEALNTLRGELTTFVCDGAYADGLTRILEAFLGSVGKRGGVPAVWISGFFGSGKSHLASMLAALWTNLKFDDGATAEGLIPGIPSAVAAPLRELRTAIQRAGGSVAAGDTLGGGAADPVEATLGIILRAAGLPSDLRAAQVALWLADLGILESIRKDLGATFDSDIRNFILSPRFGAAVRRAKPELADSQGELAKLLRAQFPEPPPMTVDLLETMGKKALLLGRKQLPLTLIVLDEVQQYIRQDPRLTLKIQTVAERLSGTFDGRVLLVATGQQALSDVPDLQKLLGRFPVQIGLGESDVDAVIRKTVLRKKPGADKPITKMLAANAGEISRHLRGSRLAHTRDDDGDAVLDWPLLPSRRRVWEHILRELDRTGLGGTLRGQLRTTLDAAKTYADKPLGHAVPVDFLYGRFASEAYNAGILPGETRNRIEALAGGDDIDRLKARILMIVYMLGRIAPDADRHGVRCQPETIADLLIVDLGGEDELRRNVPELLRALNDEGAVIEVAGQWRVQTKESAEWEAAYRTEERAVLADQAGLVRVRRELVGEAIETALAGANNVSHGQSKQQRRIHRLLPEEKAPADGVPLRLRSGYDEDLAVAEREIMGAATTDPTIHFLVDRQRIDDLNRAIATRRTAEQVISLKGVPQTDAGREAQSAMVSRSNNALAFASEIVRDAVQQARVMQAGGRLITGAPADAVKAAAANALARLYHQFADGDHPGWEKVRERAMRKDPDAIKAVDHVAAPETHPVCKILLGDLGAGRKGSDLRNRYTTVPYGWSQDVVDGALVVLANAGLVRVTGDDGKPASLPDLPRQKLGTCTFRGETTVITVLQRVAVRGLLGDAAVPFENNQEGFALSALLDRLEAAAARSGSAPPAPAPDAVPDLARYKTLTGNDLLAAVASNAKLLRSKIKSWRESEAKISERLPGWRLAEQLVQLGADDEAVEADSIRSGRLLIVSPDPVPPIIARAAEALRAKLNTLYARWEAAWKDGEQRLASDPTWSRLTPDQMHRLRQAAGLLPVPKPIVDTSQAIATTLQSRGLSEWENLVKAVPTRIDDAITAAAAVLEPKARPVSLPAGLLKSVPDVDSWLSKVRAQLVEAVADGPVIPKV